MVGQMKSMERPGPPQDRGRSEDPLSKKYRVGEELEECEEQARRPRR